MIRKIELYDTGEIASMSKSSLPDITLKNCLEVDEKYAEIFDQFKDSFPLWVKLYEFKNNKFNKKTDATIKIAEWVDEQPIILPKEYYENEDGYKIINTKKIEDLTPEELNEIVEPIPVIEDFPELPDDFIKKNLYIKTSEIGEISETK